MPYEYVEDGVTADISFRARGRDLDELFAAASDATANVMIETLDSIQTVIVKKVHVSAGALDLLLMRLLEEQIFYKDAEALALRIGRVHVEGAPGAYEVDASLEGEPIDPARHQLLADVKAVTLHGLSVRQDQEGWLAEVTLDV
jgi:SHS2 domain-containing protein